MKYDKSRATIDLLAGDGEIGVIRIRPKEGLYLVEMFEWKLIQDGKLLSTAPLRGWADKRVLMNACMEILTLIGEKDASRLLHNKAGQKPHRVYDVDRFRKFGAMASHAGKGAKGV